MNPLIGETPENEHYELFFMQFGTHQSQPPQESPELKRWKFRELKIYASTEWLADNKKKYRQVFDRHVTTYIYAELSFYNKHFDV